MLFCVLTTTCRRLTQSAEICRCVYLFYSYQPTLYNAGFNIGLRVVTPPNADQFVLESTRHFDEAYGLSFAQQLKNKDIPEGGAKAVLLVNSPGISASQREYAVRSSIKAFTDSLLDLITKDSLAQLVDYYNREELVYLGPDEQVIPPDIDWIVDRAGIRGYPIPAAFMR